MPLWPHDRLGRHLERTRTRIVRHAILNLLDPKLTFFSSTRLRMHTCERRRQRPLARCARYPAVKRERPIGALLIAFVLPGLAFGLPGLALPIGESVSLVAREYYKILGTRRT